MIRKIVISTGVVTTLAGSTSSGSTNATGTSARFYYPRGITTDGTNLYVADTNNHMIRKIVISTGAVTTLAGSTSSGSTEGTGASASFKNPMGIVVEGTNLYVADYGNHKVRKIDLTATVTADVKMHNLDDDTELNVEVRQMDKSLETMIQRWNNAELRLRRKRAQKMKSAMKLTEG